jgi:hypothetical protein
VFAVPRSMARSDENRLNRERRFIIRMFGISKKDVGSVPLRRAN